MPAYTKPEFQSVFLVLQGYLNCQLAFLPPFMECEKAPRKQVAPKSVFTALDLRLPADLCIYSK